MTGTTHLGSDYIQVEATGIPDYAVTITTAQRNWLNARPKAASDFGPGQTTVSVGQLVQFGEDIGYRCISTAH